MKLRLASRHKNSVFNSLIFDQRPTRIGLFLERNEINYIDLYDTLKTNYQERPDIRWFHDDTHPYKEGHRLK